jgi:hypothetical protein
MIVSMGCGLLLADSGTTQGPDMDLNGAESQEDIASLQGFPPRTAPDAIGGGALSRLIFHFHILWC